ncbi:hypothetical protein MNBD_NITROSPINAE05-367 [hydrothermal vent metagenome]|uniref:Lipopolysaccharide assembly protein A domain-containing protein n=1 Tax=hydrothermal vent metagenome TaxID=652676 RepID=A0A3B1DLN6_9ZZZZ
MSVIKFIIAILFLIAIAAFAVVNRHSVEVYYYDLQLAKQMIEAPMIIVGLVPFIMGFLLAWSFTVVSQVKSKAAIGKRNRTIAGLEQDVERLKPTPKTSESTVGVDRN